MLHDLGAWYWSIYFMVLIYWSMLFFLDQSTSKLDLYSWIVLLIAPLLWPITLPASRWELSRKSRKKICL